MLFVSCYLVVLLQLISLAAAQPKLAEGENPDATCEAPPLILSEQNEISPIAHGSKVVIAHRGASAHLPEHSLGGYRLALEMGADYIEPDLVSTRDGVLIAIHSCDLNATTNVAEKFPNRTTYSDFMNETGYWSYEFDYDEIKTLKLRQRLPDKRSTEYDGMFHIPTLTDILKLIQEWNEEIEPARIKSTLRRSKRGVYAELKDVPWLKHDANIDLVDLLFQHMKDNADLWSNAILQNLCDYKKLKLHEYRLPPLVVQSFEGDALKSFVDRWHETNDANAPVPPTVLLVDKLNCLEEKFWFEIDEKWRDSLAGVGPDKVCLSRHRYRAFMERAEKAELAVHPWTFRPEIEFFDSSESDFESVVQEIQHMFCTVGVHGLFSESIDSAVLASTLPCPESESHTHVPLAETQGDQLCSESAKSSSLVVGFASFLAGNVVVAVAVLLHAKRGHERRNRQMKIPTEDVDGEANGEANNNDDDDDDDTDEML